MKKLVLSLAFVFCLSVIAVGFSGCFERNYTFAEAGALYKQILTDNPDIFSAAGGVDIIYKDVVATAISLTGPNDKFKVLSKVYTNAWAQLDTVFTASMLPLKIYAHALDAGNVPNGVATDFGRKLANMESRLKDFKQIKKEIEGRNTFDANGSFDLERLGKLISAFKELNLAATEMSVQFLNIYETHIFVGYDKEQPLTSGLIKLDMIKKVVEFAAVYAKTDMLLVGDSDYLKFETLSNFLLVYGEFKAVEAITIPTITSPAVDAIVEYYNKTVKYEKNYYAELGLVNDALDRFDYRLVKNVYNNVNYSLKQNEQVYYNKTVEFVSREQAGMRAIYQQLCLRVAALAP
ncbi:MAG: hypothetical protein FWE53_02445 [Firmicutes bacterium]|nr:hypothetical protein [Bacillota bacterium]